MLCGVRLIRLTFLFCVLCSTVNAQSDEVARSSSSPRREDGDLGASPPVCDFGASAALGEKSSKRQEIPLWSGVAPGSEGITEVEVVVERGKTAPNRSIRHVHRPTMTLYLPDGSSTNRPAVIICPGGGYGGLAIDKEGHDIARWFNSIGVVGVVLKYRLPTTKTHRYAHDVPLQDAQRSIRLVRAKAQEWGIDSKRIGVMGFSAGGHLASTASTHFESGPKETDSDLAKISARPDFSILIYPVVSFSDAVGHTGSRRNLLGSPADPQLVKLYSNELQVTKDTPPAFLIHTSDDGVKAENSVLYYLACRRAKVRAEMHIFEKGGHGYGMLPTGRPVAGWPSLCEKWLRETRVLRGE